MTRTGVIHTSPASSDGALTGQPANPGRATGAVRVVHDPLGADRFQLGEILVAPAATPAWTPLFGRAAAVVTDGGALAAHASLVAREYGILTVVGTGDATRRLVDGQAAPRSSAVPVRCSSRNARAGTLGGPGPTSSRSRSWRPPAPPSRQPTGATSATSGTSPPSARPRLASPRSATHPPRLPHPLDGCSHRRDERSYLTMLTAFYVDNGPRLPLWELLPPAVFWFLPTAAGIPLIARALARHLPKRY